jgi:hypothetical protein
MNQLVCFKKKYNYLYILYLENKKRLLYLHPHSQRMFDLLEKWQSGRLRQS